MHKTVAVTGDIRAMYPSPKMSNKKEQTKRKQDLNDVRLTTNSEVQKRR